MPLAALDRAFGVSSASKRGPRRAAALICATTPTWTRRSASVAGPLVKASHSGFEQRSPTLFPSLRLVVDENSSRFDLGAVVVGGNLGRCVQHLIQQEQAPLDHGPCTHRLRVGADARKGTTPLG